MSGKATAVDRRVAVTLKLIADNPKLKVPAAMRAAKFTTAESEEPRCQMWIRRRLPAKSPSTKPSISLPGLGVSSITNASPHASLKYPPPKAKQKRQNSVAKQQTRVDDKKLKEHAVRAHNRATSFVDGKQFSKLRRLAVLQVLSRMTQIM